MRCRRHACPWAALVCSLAASPAKAEEPVFQLDPVADSVFFGATLLVAGTSEAIITTGEIEAQLPDDQTELLGIDRWAAERHTAQLRGEQTSDLGVAVAAAWAIADTTLAGFDK